MQREARGVVQSYFAQSLPTAEVLDRIRHDPSLGAEVAGALEQAAAYGRGLVTHEAERQVEALYAQPLLRPEVLERLRADPALAQRFASRPWPWRSPCRKCRGTSTRPAGPWSASRVPRPPRIGWP